MHVKRKDCILANNIALLFTVKTLESLEFFGFFEWVFKKLALSQSRVRGYAQWEKEELARRALMEEVYHDRAEQVKLKHHLREQATFFFFRN